MKYDMRCPKSACGYTGTIERSMSDDDEFPFCPSCEDSRLQRDYSQSRIGFTGFSKGTDTESSGSRELKDESPIIRGIIITRETEGPDPRLN